MQPPIPLEKELLLQELRVPDSVEAEEMRVEEISENENVEDLLSLLPHLHEEKREDDSNLGEKKSEESDDIVCVGEKAARRESVEEESKAVNADEVLLLKKTEINEKDKGEIGATMNGKKAIKMPQRKEKKKKRRARLQYNPNDRVEEVGESDDEYVQKEGEEKREEEEDKSYTNVEWAEKEENENDENEAIDEANLFISLEERLNRPPSSIKRTSGMTGYVNDRLPPPKLQPLNANFYQSSSSSSLLLSARRAAVKANEKISSYPHYGGAAATTSSTHDLTRTFLSLSPSNTHIDAHIHTHNYPHIYTCTYIHSDSQSLSLLFFFYFSLFYALSHTRSRSHTYTHVFTQHCF